MHHNGMRHPVGYRSNHWMHWNLYYIPCFLDNTYSSELTKFCLLCCFGIVNCRFQMMSTCLCLVMTVYSYRKSDLDSRSPQTEEKAKYSRVLPLEKTNPTPDHMISFNLINRQSHLFLCN